MFMTFRNIFVFFYQVLDILVFIFKCGEILKKNLKRLENECDAYIGHVIFESLLLIIALFIRISDTLQ